MTCPNSHDLNVMGLRFGLRDSYRLTPESPALTTVPYGFPDLKGFNFSVQGIWYYSSNSNRPHPQSDFSLVMMESNRSVHSFWSAVLCGHACGPCLMDRACINPQLLLA